MKLAVMQPYFFPYIGYFQLLRAVDRFVMYDDVNFIKGGWINRNFILMHCRPLRITVPLVNASPFRTIAATEVSSTGMWHEKLLKTFRQAYANAPFFAAVYALVEEVIEHPRSSLAALALASIQAIGRYLALNTEIRPSALPYANRSLTGQTRVLDICKREGAHAYYNLPGGTLLYDPAAFAANGLELYFVEPSQPRYRQFRCEFVPRLSILDALMFNAPEMVNEYLTHYRAIRAC